MKKLYEILSQIGLTESNGLFYLHDKSWNSNTAFPNRVKRLIERKIKPDAFFCFDNKPMVMFFENRKDKEKLHKAIWNFNECPIAIFVDNGSIEIFNGFNYLQDKAALYKIGGGEKLTDFSYLGLVTGKTWEQYKNELNYKNRVDYHLLENIKSARKLLVEKHKLDAKIVNSIIGKSIFVRYLIDRGVKMKFDGTLRKWTNDEFCELLDSSKRIKDFFDYLEDSERGFNGDLFPLSASEYNLIKKEDYQVIKRLLKGDNIENNQLSLFVFYDFSIIPIEFISNVYELFIGQDNQKKEGAYYTPLFLVDYILKETVEKKIGNRNANYNCKVLDPACGSGIFLVESLRKIIENYIKETECDVKAPNFKTAIKKLAKDNIFGIDKDLSAVQVAVFSIYLTLLDYLEPPGIETFKFPILLNLNFFEADFFNLNSQFNTNLKDIEFDFILGNPPWMRGKGEKEKPAYVAYLEKRRKQENNSDEIKAEIGNKEIAQAFLIRSSDFSKQQTKCALIVTSKTLYNLQSQNFRKYFLKNFFIERVFELAPVRREIFDKSNDKAVAPACVLFYQYANGQNTGNNTIEHITLKPSRFFSLFKIFTINRADYKNVQQNRMNEYDWLWKVLVYGSYLDFNFIRRLFNEEYSIGGTIDKYQLLFKQGLKRKDGGKKILVKELVGKPFLDTQKGELQPFRIVDSGLKWESKEVGYIFKKDNKPYTELFKPYSLLITGGIFNDFTSNAAINRKERVFTSSIRALKISDYGQLDILSSINLILCSSLFSYYMLSTGASAGIEREESEDEEIKRMWYRKIPNSNQIVEKYETSHPPSLLSDVTLINAQTSKEFSDKYVIDTFQLNEQEESLLDYATNINIPMVMRHNGYERLFHSLNYEDSILKDYASVFINRFKSKLDSAKKKFVVELWHTNQIVGMFFKMIPVAKYKSDIVWKNKQHNDTEIISLLTKISSEKITDKLFVQKDIRGFEKENFYIFKPNEKRLWHKAIGYLDVNEFADAILRKGNKIK